MDINDIKSLLTRFEDSSYDHHLRLRLTMIEGIHKAVNSLNEETLDYTAICCAIYSRYEVFS